MAGFLHRPMTVRIVCDDDVSTRDVISSLTNKVEGNEIKCVTQTTRNGWQITFDTETARDAILASGLTINEQHYDCTALSSLQYHDRRRDDNPPAFVTCKLPYEMPDSTIKSVLHQYGQVTKVHRRCYAFAPTIETGVRMYTVVNPKGNFPTSCQVGRYLVRFYIRYAGQPTRCYRCDSADHHIRECPHPAGYHRCYQCGGEGHMYRNCPERSNVGVHNGSHDTPRDREHMERDSTNNPDQTTNVMDSDDDKEQWQVQTTNVMDSDDEEQWQVPNDGKWLSEDTASCQEDEEAEDNESEMRDTNSRTRKRHRSPNDKTKKCKKKPQEQNQNQEVEQESRRDSWEAT